MSFKPKIFEYIGSGMYSIYQKGADGFDQTVFSIEVEAMPKKPKNVWCSSQKRRLSSDEYKDFLDILNWHDRTLDDCDNPPIYKIEPKRHDT